MSWEELLTKVKWHGETLDVAGKRRSMTSLDESLGLSSEEMISRDTVGTRTRKLCSFSGAKDSEPGVVDYDTWRMYASSVVDSTQLSENERKRILIDSLLRPALDIATTLDATKTSQDLLHVLDHHYGEVRYLASEGSAHSNLVLWTMTRGVCMPPLLWTAHSLVRMSGSASS